MGKKVSLEPSYYAPNITSLNISWDKGVPVGEPSRVSAMDKVFKWKRGNQSAWYGWPNSGKGTFFDYMAVIKSKYDGWKWLMYKQEDMSSRKKKDGTVELTADDIYNNLVWTFTGKTPYKHIATQYHQPQISYDEYQDAMEWVEKHFFIIYPKDRRFRNVMDTFKMYHEQFGVDGFLIDPFKSLILDGDERGDMMMTKVFIESKEFALMTDSCFNYISHPKTLQGGQKNKDGTYKIVDGDMQLGGSAWQINMDSEYTIYRPNAHKKPNDPEVMFRNLKQRKQQIVMANKGDCENIKLDFLRNQYYFDGVNPIDGSVNSDHHKEKPKQGDIFDKAAKKAKDDEAEKVKPGKASDSPF